MPRPLYWIATCCVCSALACSSDDSSAEDAADSAASDTAQPDQSVDQMPAADQGPDLPTTPGKIGDVCTETRKCEQGLHCFVFPSVPGSGFCTQQCTDVTKACKGVDSTLVPFCLLEDSGSYYCAFMCKLIEEGHTHEYDCPPELKCNTQLIPPATMAYLCIP